MHPCVVKGHCGYLPGKGVIINGAVQKKWLPTLQGLDPIEASVRF